MLNSLSRVCGLTEHPEAKKARIIYVFIKYLLINFILFYINAYYGKVKNVK
jgi:hypothetical protein